MSDDDDDDDDDEGVSWIDRIQKANPVSVDEMYPPVVDESESAFGFKLVEIPNPKAGYAFSSAKIRAASVQLAPDRQAVKILSPVTNSIQYAVLDDKFRPIEDVAFSLAQLRTRFPR